MLAFPQPRHLPCPNCGQSVPREQEQAHVCDDERRLDYTLVQLRAEVAALDDQLAAWLESPQGKFAAWLAERGRRSGDGERGGEAAGGAARDDDPPPSRD